MKTYSRKKVGENFCSNEIIINLNELCRLCLKKENDLIPIFNANEQGVPISIRILSCAGVEAFDGDGLPNTICANCLVQLDKSYSFRKKCQYTDKKLKRHLQQIKDKNEIFDFLQSNQQSSEELQTNSKNESTNFYVENIEESSQNININIQSEEYIINAEGNNNPQDLVGAKIEIIVPPGEDEDNDEDIKQLESLHLNQPNIENNITLDFNDEVNKNACTLKTVLKEEFIDASDCAEINNLYDLAKYSTNHIENEEDNNYNDPSDVQAMQLEIPEDIAIDDDQINAIVNAVKTTLADESDLDLTGHVKLKLEFSPNKTIQVEVQTKNGHSAILQIQTDESQIFSTIKNENNKTDETVLEDNFKSDHETDDYDLFENADLIDVNYTKTVDSALKNFVENDPDDPEELKIFKCPDCPKAFSRRIHLRRHSSVHMTQRGFTCGICEKWCPTKSALVRHERIHTGERPFSCEMCPKSFAQKEILYRHVMTHTGQKPFTCTHCEKGFTQKESLKIHIRNVHALTLNPKDLKVHKCTFCPKIFYHSSGLSRHLTWHKGKTYKCGDCDRTFNDKSSVRRHHKLTNHQAIINNARRNEEQLY